MKINRDLNLIEKIFEEITDIENFTDKIVEERFMYDKEKQKAVCLSFQNIGEYSNNISDELKHKYSNVEWRNMKGFRNLIAHEYGKVSMGQVWNMVKVDLPRLKSEIQKMINDLSI